MGRSLHANARALTAAVFLSLVSFLMPVNLVLPSSIRFVSSANLTTATAPPHRGTKRGSHN
eukprot:2298813-Amphidinium_carterae.1